MCRFLRMATGSTANAPHTSVKAIDDGDKQFVTNDSKPMLPIPPASHDVQKTENRDAAPKDTASTWRTNRWARTAFARGSYVVDAARSVGAVRDPSADGRAVIGCDGWPRGPCWAASGLLRCMTGRSRTWWWSLVKRRKEARAEGNTFCHVICGHKRWPSSDSTFWLFPPCLPQIKSMKRTWTI